MSIKKIMLLASMALAATALAAASASATGNGVWVDNGQHVEEPIDVYAEGKAKFNTLGSGLECTVTATITSDGETASTGTVHFKVEIATCEGFGATFAGCEVEAITNTGPNSDFTWEYHLTKTPPRIITTGVKIDSHLKNCGKDTTVSIAFTTVVATPDNAAAISTVTLSSTGGTAKVNGGAALPNAASGDLTVQGAAKGTYGIE